MDKVVARARPAPGVDLRPVLFVVGLLTLIVGLAMVIPGAVGLALGTRNGPAFIAAAAITIAVGGFLTAGNRVPVPQMTLRQIYILTVLVWVTVPGFAALPFVFSELDLSYTEAYFEAMSGLTTTGSTVLVGLDTMPHSILLWRGLLQWLGGIGIVVMSMAVLPLLRTGGMQLFHAESSDRHDKPLPRVAQLVKVLLFAYLTLSGTCALAYWYAGMSGFDAVVHAMSTISTGGYSSHDLSFAYFASPTLEWLGTLFMLSGALPFVLYIRASRGDLALLRDQQVRAFAFAVLASTVLLAVWLALRQNVAPLDALRLAAFNATSIITTTGFASADYNLWGGFAVAVFFYLTFIGGCTGSTAGAIKIFRFRVMWIVFGDYLFRRFSPHGVGRRSYDGRPLDDDVIEGVLAFAVIYALAVAVIAVGLGVMDLDLITSLSGAATALGNVGPGLGPIIGPVGNFATLPDSAMWLLAFGMLLGRLELFTVLVLLTPRFWRN
ncbi:MAG TPA: TrkH family potassium uptake protein [Geminicoccaceae bacterium]